MANNERKIRGLEYMAQHYPLVAFGLVRISIKEFLQRYKQYMTDLLGSCTDEDIAWAEQYIAEIESYNHAFIERAER